MKRTGRRWWPVVLTGLGVLALATIGGIFGVLPLVLKQRCIAAAASQGVTLTIDHVAIGPGDARLVDVAFTLPGVPQLKGAAESVQVTLVGLSPGPASVSALSLTLDGPLEDLQKALAAWAASRAQSAPASPVATPVTWSLGHLTWARAFGDAAKVEMTFVDGGTNPATGTSHLGSDHVTVTTGKATFGPWRVTADRDPQTVRLVVDLDPVVQGGPSALFVRDASLASSVKVAIPSSPLSRIGIPAKSVGLASDATVEASLDLEVARTGAATLKGAVEIDRAVFAGAPIDAKLTLSAAGTAAQGLDVKQGELTAGPLRATVTGKVELFDDGARLGLAWRSVPVPCSQIGKQMAAQALGSVGAQLGAVLDTLGGAVGVRVAGEAVASGLIALDSRDVSSAGFTMTTNDTCGIALF